LEAIMSLDALRLRADDRRRAYARFHRPARLVEFVCGAQALEMAKEACLV
jgi:hypothetical protein